MTISLYAASVPVFQQMLNAMSDVLKKAEAHATEKTSTRTLSCRHACTRTCFR